MPQATFGAAQFLMPVQQCEFQLTCILESLTRNPWPMANDKRPCIAVFKAETDDSPDVLRWLDRMLIRLQMKVPEYLTPRL